MRGRRGRRSRRFPGALFTIVVLAVVGLAIYGIFHEPEGFFAGDVQPAMHTSPVFTAEAAATAVQTSVPTPEPTQEPTPEPTPTPHPWPDVPRQSGPAPEGYFADAAFVGNSLVEGLDLYFYNGHLDGADFYADTSMTVLGVDDYLRQMAGMNYGKVYIGLGMNEIDYDRGVLRDEFQNLIDTVRSYNPNVIVYIMSVTPVSRIKSDNDSLHNMTNVRDFNEFLLGIAEDNECYYMDLVSVLAGDDGYLPSDQTNDGIHFTQDYYKVWFDYLEYNYVLPEPGAGA